MNVGYVSDSIHRSLYASLSTRKQKGSRKTHRGRAWRLRERWNITQTCVLYILLIILLSLLCILHHVVPNPYNWTHTLDGYCVKWCACLIF